MLTLMMFTLVASDYRSFASTACAQADAGIESCCHAMEMSCCKPLAGPESEEDCACDILPVPAFPVDNEAPALTVTPGSAMCPAFFEPFRDSAFRLPISGRRRGIEIRGPTLEWSLFTARTAPSCAESLHCSWAHARVASRQRGIYQ